MIRPLAVIAVLVVVLAGCTAAPIPPTSTATPEPGAGTPGQEPGDVSVPYVVLENDRSTTLVLTVYLVEGPLRQFRVSFSDGTTKVMDQSEITGHATDVEPTGTVLAKKVVEVAPNSAVVVPLENCQQSTDFWFKYAEKGTTNYGYTGAKDCQGYTAKESVGPQSGGYSEGGDYLDVLSEPGTSIVHLRAEHQG